MERSGVTQRRRFAFATIVALAVATGATYWQVQENGFVNFDDDLYITGNPALEEGLSLHGILWAFTTTRAGNWHPLTWISYLVDVSLFGMNPSGHHLMSLLLHIAATVLLFLALSRATGMPWESACVALLFALHPLHVESVAWASERKDVLSGLLWMGTLLAYVRHVERQSASRYALVLVLFLLGLLSKPMLVTLPFVLLLLDYWPLQRTVRHRGNTQSRFTAARWSALLLEKAPLLAMAAASSIVTFLVQRESGSISSLQGLTFPVRVANAITAYGTYLIKTALPLDLAVFYPHPGPDIPLSAAAGSAAVLVVISVFALRLRNRHPYLAVGWAWFLGTLVPVIGLIQVGDQSMADRYMYVPIVGLLLMVVWGISHVTAVRPALRAAVLTTGGGIGLGFAILSFQQVGVWRDSFTLFHHALSVTGNNAVAHQNLAAAYIGRGQFGEAREHTLQALALNPNVADVHYNMGVALAGLDSLAAAREHLQNAVQLRPQSAKARNNLGVVLGRMGRMEEAIEQFQASHAIRPDDPEVLYNLSIALIAAGRTDEAEQQLLTVLQLDPDFAAAHVDLARVLAARGETGQGIMHFREAVRLSPGNVAARNELGKLLASRGLIDEAREQFRYAVMISPTFAEAHNNLGLVSAMQGKMEEAVKHFSEAVRIRPDYREAHANLERAMKTDRSVHSPIQKKP